MAPIQVQSKKRPSNKLKKRTKRPSHAYPATQASGPNTSASPAEPISTPGSQPPDSEPTASNAQTSSSAAPNAPRTSTTDDPHPPISTRHSQKDWQKWMYFVAWLALIVAIIGVIVTIIDVIATIVFGKHLDGNFQELMKLIKWITHSDFTESCRYYQVNKNETTPDCDRALNERPQPLPERRQILKRSFGSSTDLQQDSALVWRAFFLAAMGVLALSTHYKLGLGRLLSREHLKWPPPHKWNVNDGLREESNSRPARRLFVGARSDDQTYQFIRLEATDLKDSSTLLSRIAESFQIWSMYEASYRLENSTELHFLDEGAVVHPGRPFHGEFTEMNCSPPPQKLMTEYYTMEPVSLDEGRMPPLVQPPMCFSLAPLVGQEPPLRIANHGKPRTEDREEWGIVLSKGKTIIDKAMMSVCLEINFETFEILSVNEIPFFFFIGAQLIPLGLLDAFVGLNIRSIFYKKLPITLIFVLFVLTHVMSPKGNGSGLLQLGVLMLCRLLGSYYLLWKY